MVKTIQSSFQGSPINTKQQLRCLTVALSLREDLLTELQSHGFYGLTDASDEETIKNGFRSTGSVQDDLFADATNRVGFIDCETASESGVVPLFNDVSNIIVQSGVQLQSISEEWSHNSHGDLDQYMLKTDNLQIILWTVLELRRSSDSWLLAGDRFVSFINSMLEHFESSERLYYEFTGNDTLVVLLTDGMVKVLRDFGAVS